MSNNIIVFELDDVLVDTDTYLKNQIIKYTNYDISDRQDPLIELPGFSEKDNQKLLDELYPIAFKNARPITGSIEAVKELSKYFRIKFIPDRKLQENVKQITEDWLKSYIKNEFDYSIDYSNRGSKLPYISEDVKYCVEDHPDFAMELSEKVDSVFLLDKSWNRTKSFKKNVIRFENFPALIQYIRTIEKFQ